MAIGERLNSLKLESRASINEGIYKIVLAEVLEPHLDWNFQLGSRIASAQLSFIYFFVEETAKLLVNVEDTAHYVIRDSTEIVLI
ncbi:MAG TPA: hypothetical protein VJ810_11235 [Blastocatellia bacterium]|nr:hypothetical protein [Blastocatellia bacterium]